jgi:hypothetical protein
VGLRRVLVLAGLVFAGAPVASAAATTIGQTGGSNTCSPNAVGTVAADTKYVVPSGGGRITSFAFRSMKANAGQQLEFLLLRPSSGDSYTVVGQTPLVTLAATGIETFRANIPAQAGDILGTWINAALNNCLSILVPPTLTLAAETFVGAGQRFDFHRQLRRPE